MVAGRRRSGVPCDDVDGVSTIRWKGILMSRMLRTSAALIAVGVMGVLGAAPALAMSESGFKSCSPNTVTTRGQTKGWAVHYFDGVPFNKGYHSDYFVTYANEGWVSANWKVDGSIGINYVGTYAYCPA